MKPMLEPLTDCSLKRRIFNSFPSIYLTLISIIQGVALGILVINTFKYVDSSTNWPFYIPYSILSFILIIMVSYQYTWFVGVLRWPPKVWDTVIPFSLGLFEVIPMFHFTNPQLWWFWTSVFSFVGALAFLNSFCNCSTSMFEDENNQAYLRTKRELKWNIIISLIVTLFSLLVWILHSIILIHWYWEILFVLSFWTVAIGMIWKGERFMNALYEDFGFLRH